MGRSGRVDRSSLSRDGEECSMRAAVRPASHQPLAVEAADLDQPHAGEVLVRIAASGVCASALHVLDGTSTIAKPPMVLGHEGAGVIEAVGEGVEGLQPGDHVVIALYGPCGGCADCRE